MKKALLILFFSSTSFCVMAQPPKKSIPTPVLKTALDSFSYAVGMSIVLQYKEFGVKTLNTNAVMKAVNDILANKKPIITTEQANYVLNNYINQLMAEKAAENKKAGAAFLAANKAKPGVITLPSGLQYQVIRQGSGAIPGPKDSVVVHYIGSLIDGTVFESSVEKAEPVTFTVNGVVAGWTEALLMMPAGSRWKLFIPAELGYGNFSQPGSPIPPGATLIFDLELLSVVGK